MSGYLADRAIKELLGQSVTITPDLHGPSYEFDELLVDGQPITDTLTFEQVEQKIHEILPEESLKLLRVIRNVRLSETDYVFVSDYPLLEDKRQDWINYRQQLRDLPANSPNVSIDLETGELTGVVWPTEPTN